LEGRATYVETGNPWLLVPPKVIFLLAYLSTLVAFIRAEKSFVNLLRFSTIGYFCYFMLSAGVHENHLFLPSILVMGLAAMDSRYQPAALCIVLLANLNLVLFYGLSGSGLPFSRVVGGVDVALIVSILSLAFFCIMFQPVVAEVGSAFRSRRAREGMGGKGMGGRRARGSLAQRPGS
jgi:hypothetical protein